MTVICNWNEVESVVVDGVAIKSTKMCFSRAFAMRSTRNSFLFSIYLEIVIMRPTGDLRCEIIQMWCDAGTCPQPICDNFGNMPSGRIGWRRFELFASQRETCGRSAIIVSIVASFQMCETFLNRMNCKAKQSVAAYIRYWPRAIFSCALSRQAMRCEKLTQ